MSEKTKIGKREAHRLAAELGLEVEATATAEQVCEEIQQAVDEWAILVADTESAEDDGGAREWLGVAAAAGFEPGELEAEVVEGEVVEGGVDGDTEDEALKDAENEAVEVESAIDLTVGEVADEVGRALALREQAVVPTHALPTPAEYNVLGLLANRTFNTTFVPIAYRGREADVFAAFLFGREIGLGPMMALRDIHMIEGRPALAAHRQLAKLREGGVVIVESESTGERAWVKARRTDTGEVMAVEFTLQEASLVVDKKGNRLVDKINWRSYPADMLWARAVGRLTRRLGPDIAGGLPPYTAEEVADFSGWGVEYGEGGPVMRAPEQQSRQAPPSYRQEFPDYNWPSSMAEIRDRMGLILGADEAVEWLGQARRAMYPGVEVAAYTKTQKDLLFQKLSTILADLDGPDGPTEFEPGVRAKISDVFARRLDGVILDGPAWSLGPDEAETRPRRETPSEATGAPETAAEAEAAPAAAGEAGEAGEAHEGSESYYAQFDDVDDIPFGPAGSDSP